MDRRRLSAVLPWPWRCLARWRSRRAGSGQDRIEPDNAADREGNGAAGGTMAADARRRRASVVELLPRVEETRRRNRRAGKNEQRFKQNRCRKTDTGGSKDHGTQN